MAFPSDLQQHLIEMPLVAGSGPGLWKSRGIRLTELGAPLADRLVADDDAALGGQGLGVTEAEGEKRKYNHTA
jgi:hypothetical protein